MTFAVSRLCQVYNSLGFTQSQKLGENCMRTLRKDMRHLVAVVVALTPGIVVFGLPTQSQAQSTTISGVTVQLGGTTFSLWSPQAISAGQTLVLAQNPPANPTPPFNFDTSDVAGCP